MEVVSTAVVVGIVVVLMLLGIGIVINQLMRLRKYLNQAPPDAGDHDLPGSTRPED
jgi:hypothetical protein